jgi:diguanylate cyclase (GGDEF)-like protein
VLLLGRADREAELIQGLVAGADDYLVTPLRRADLHRRVLLGLRIAGLEDRLHQLRQEHDQLRMQDTLTGLFTRQALYQSLTTLAETTGRVEIPLTLVLVRLEELQTINQKYGYAVGNQAIQQVATLVGHCVRQGDLVGRWSGPALLIVLPDTPPAAAQAVSARVQERIAATPLRLPKQAPLPLPVRIQVATTTIAARGNLATLVQKAEEISGHTSLKSHRAC